MKRCQDCHSLLRPCPSCGDPICDCPGAKPTRNAMRWHCHYDKAGQKRDYTNVAWAGVTSVNGIVRWELCFRDLSGGLDL